MVHISNIWYIYQIYGTATQSQKKKRYKAVKLPILI